MTSKDNQNSDSKQYLISLGRDPVSFRSKIMEFCLLRNSYPIFFEMLLMLTSFIQLLGQVFATACDLSPYTPSFSIQSATTPLLLLMTFSPSYIVSFKSNNPTTTNVLTFLLCYVVMKYLFLSYILLMAARKSKLSKAVIYIWKITLLIQDRVVCFIITSFCTEVILAARRRNFTCGSMNGVTLVILASFIFIIEYLFSFIVQSHFIYTLPSKSFLASKKYKGRDSYPTSKIGYPCTEINATH